MSSAIFALSGIDIVWARAVQPIIPTLAQPFHRDGRICIGGRSGAKRSSANERSVKQRLCPVYALYITDAVLNARVLALAKAGDFESAIAAAGSARLYTPAGDEWRAIGAAAGRQGAVDAVRSRGSALKDEWRRAMFLLGLAEGLLERAASKRTATPPETAIAQD